MSQRAVFIEVDGMLYNEIFRSMPDYDECVSIIKDIGLDTEGSVDVVAAWYEIGEGESDTDEFFKEAELLHLYDTDTLEKEMERLRKMTYYCFTSDCLRDYILKYFGEYGSAHCGKCANCLTEFEEIDVTGEAAVLFYLVKTSKNRYGISAIVDAAHGSNNEKIRKFRLQENPYYGRLSRVSVFRLRQIVNELLLRGFFLLTADEYPVLKITAKAVDWLEDFDSTERIMLKLPRQQKSVLDNKEIHKKRAKRGVIEAVKYPDLFERLRVLRMELAKIEHVPPYSVFADKTLTEMSTYLPDDKEKMLKVSGVGNHKYEKYGEAFEEVIREYCREHRIDTDDITG